jgi:hypothetical protein
MGIISDFADIGCARLATVHMIHSQKRHRHPARAVPAFRAKIHAK